MLLEGAVKDKYFGITIENSVLADADEILVTVKREFWEETVVLIKNYERKSIAF